MGGSARFFFLVLAGADKTTPWAIQPCLSLITTPSRSSDPRFLTWPICTEKVNTMPVGGVTDKLIAPRPISLAARSRRILGDLPWGYPTVPISYHQPRPEPRSPIFNFAFFHFFQTLSPRPAPTVNTTDSKPTSYGLVLSSLSPRTEKTRLLSLPTDKN